MIISDAGRDIHIFKMAKLMPDKLVVGGKNDYTVFQLSLTVVFVYCKFCFQILLRILF